MYGVGRGSVGWPTGTDLRRQLVKVGPSGGRLLRTWPHGANRDKTRDGAASHGDFDWLTLFL